MTNKFHFSSFNSKIIQQDWKQNLFSVLHLFTFIERVYFAQRIIAHIGIADPVGSLGFIEVNIHNRHTLLSKMFS